MSSTTMMQAITIKGGTFTVKGKVVSLSTGNGLGGLTVEVWDKDLVFRDDSLGTTETNENGEFSRSFDKADFKDLMFDRRPDLYFKVFQDDLLLLNTKEQVIMNADVQTPPIVLKVAAELEEAKNWTWFPVPHVAQYKGGDWENLIAHKKNVSLKEAWQIAEDDPDISFFFYMDHPMFLEGNPPEWTEKGQFDPKDAVFFSGSPWWGHATMANGWEKRQFQFLEKPNCIQFKGADWDNEVDRKSGITLEEAKEHAAADPHITYFFFTKDSVFLEGKEGENGWTEKGQFEPGDAVFFTGKPHYGSASQAVCYEKHVITWTKKENTAQYGGASWDNEITELRRANSTLEEAQKIANADPRVQFFFLMKSSMFLGGKEGPNGWSAKGQFNEGDAVFFSGHSWLGSAPQADTYIKTLEPLVDYFDRHQNNSEDA